MKRVFAVIVAMLNVFVVNVQAQITNYPWYETFYPESELNDFLFFDNDNDGYMWEHVSVETEGGTGHNGSAGWIYSWSDNYNGSSTQDNLMVLPILQIPSAETNLVLSWYDRGQNGDYYVYIRQVEGTHYVSDLIASSPIASYHVSSVGYGEGWGNVWVRREVSLSSYAGQNIFVTFRHYNSGSTGISIDDIRVGQPSTVDPTESEYPHVDFCIDSLGYQINSSDSTTVTLCCTYNTNIESLIIPSNVVFNNENYTVTMIGDNAFSGIFSLSSVSIPETVNRIGVNTFSGCTSLSTFSFGSNVTSIGNYAFSGCIGISALTLPNSMAIIGDGAFNGCTGLTSVTIGNGVILLGNDAFGGCNNIITVNYNAVDCRQGGGAFQGLAGLTTLNIGSEVHYIPANMFSGCTGLVSLTLPDAVTEIGVGAFSGCVNLTNANLGNGLTTVSNRCFYNCLRLMTVRLGDALAEIGQEAFYNCGIVGELVIPQGVISIGSRAFMQCYGINKITAMGRVAPMLEYEYNGYSGEYGTVGPFHGVDSNIVVNIPCETTNMYAGRWQQFHNFVEMPFLFNAISEDVNKGTVTVEEEPTCDNPYATIRATPKSGYHFDHWSDGSTQNPYSYTATGSVTLIGYFASNEAIEEACGESLNISLSNGRMVVNGAEGNTVRVYNVMGHMVATATNGESFALPGSGVYVVKVGETALRKVVVIR